MKGEADIATKFMQWTCIAIEMKVLNSKTREILFANHDTDFNKLINVFFLLDAIQCQPELSKRKNNFPMNAVERCEKCVGIQPFLICIS